MEEVCVPEGSSVRNKCHVMCCVPQCQTMSNKCTNSILHKFPKNKKMRTAWAAKLKIGKKVSHSFVVCNKHFTDADYKNSKYINMVLGIIE